MKRIIPCIVAFLVAMPIAAFAHSGRPDSNGGHHDYNNVSGLGDYHYHHGYGPHLHEDGICPYDTEANVNQYLKENHIAIDVPDNYEEESYTMTESELADYVYEQVHSDPSAYDIVPASEFQELGNNYAALKESTVDRKEAVNDTLIGVGVTALIGIAICYFIYRKYSGEYKRGYEKGYDIGLKDGRPPIGNDTDIHTYCQVIFKDNGFGYYYRTNDPNIQVGDKVVVPANGEEVIATVISMNQYAAYKAPYPLKKTKTIIRKADD